MVNKTWQNEWLKLKSVKHKIKTQRPSQAMQSFGRAGPGCGLTGEKSAVQIGTELLLHGTSHTVSGLHAMPAQHSTFLDCKVWTRPEPCGFQVW
jgi:hypothetical protein